MKSRNQAWNVPLVFFCLLLVLLAENGCKKKKNNTVNFQLDTLTGAQVVPPNNSSATASFTQIQYDKDSKILSYTVQFSNINPIGMDVCQGDPGMPGTVVSSVPVPTYGFLSPFVAAVDSITPAQEADLLAGKWYLSIRSNTYPNGELRGRIIPQ